MHRKRLILFAAFVAVLGIFELAAAQRGEKVSEAPKSSSEQRPLGETAPAEEKLSITSHTFNPPGGPPLNYKATAGFLRLKDESGKAKAEIFFVAYSAEDGNDSRPITFAFNGGPGASSIWLHMGIAGPVRVITDSEVPPSAPFSPAVPNRYSWLRWTDLVFIDPVGTGFSRAIPPESAKQYFNVQDDVHSIGDFIQLYTSRFGRWRSPKCLAGESYGGMRAAGLMRYLYENYGMEIDRLLLISPALDLNTIQPDSTNDLPYMLFVPSYAAVAWYHKKTAPEIRSSLPDVLSQAEKWAIEEYLPALAKGDLLSGPDKERIAARLADLTGLPGPFVRNRNIRIPRPLFTGELMRPEGLSVAFMDGRLTRSAGGSRLLEDPAITMTVGPYSSALNAYLREELQFNPSIPYIFFSGDVNSSWNWGGALSENEAVDSIRKAMERNGRLRILAASGFFDLDIPYFATTYTMSHLGEDPRLSGNIRVRFFPGGHMFYTNSSTLEDFTGEIGRLFGGALSVDK